MERTVRADAATPIIKPLPPEEFVDFASGEHGYNAETRWEALAETGYLTPNDRFFIRSHAPTPRLDAPNWRLRVDGPGVERPLELAYDDVLHLPAITVTRALECAGNGRVFFAERQGREAPGTPLEARRHWGGGVDRGTAAGGIGSGPGSRLRLAT